MVPAYDYRYFAKRWKSGERMLLQVGLMMVKISTTMTSTRLISNRRLHYYRFREGPFVHLPPCSNCIVGIAIFGLAEMKRPMRHKLRSSMSRHRCNPMEEDTSNRPVWRMPV